MLNIQNIRAYANRNHLFLNSIYNSVDIYQVDSNIRDILS